MGHTSLSSASSGRAGADISVPFLFKNVFIYFQSPSGPMCEAFCSGTCADLDLDPRTRCAGSRGSESLLSEQNANRLRRKKKENSSASPSNYSHRWSSQQGTRRYKKQLAMLAFVCFTSGAVRWLQRARRTRVRSTAGLRPCYMFFSSFLLFYPGLHESRHLRPWCS